jgi:uncharacterized DUF497 family protein
MKKIAWNLEKNEQLKAERHISFEDIVVQLSHGNVLDVLEHPNQERYPGQRIFIVEINNYACLVPFVENEAELFLKTIIPSRKATRDYLHKGKRK